MKLRKLVAVLLAMLLALGALFSAGAEYVVKDTHKIDDSLRYYTMNTNHSRLVMTDRNTGFYKLTAIDQTPLTTKNYIRMDSYTNYYKVQLENGINVLGALDKDGKEIVPPAYGDIDWISDRWMVGILLTESDVNNYDYKSSSGNNTTFYLIKQYDFYYKGTLAGSLERSEYKNCMAYGDYLYVRDHENNFTFYDKNFNLSPYQDTANYEYAETKNGIFHRGSGQQAFHPGCTLTSDEVDQDFYKVDGRMVDLQGNVIFPLDAKYSSIREYDGDYAVVYQNGKYGLIDRTGKEIIPCENEQILGSNGYFLSGYQACVKDGKVGFYNTNGEVTCEFKYSNKSLKGSYYDTAFVTLTDMTGEIIVLSGAVGQLPGTYAEAEITSYSHFIALKDTEGKCGVMDIYGNVVIPFSDDYSAVYNIDVSANSDCIVARSSSSGYSVYVMEKVEAEETTQKTGITGFFDRLTKQSDEEQTADDDVTTEPETSDVDDGSWVCSNGHKMTGKFCSECGEPRPAEKLVCGKCGYAPEEGTTPKFCAECGNAF